MGREVSLEIGMGLSTWVFFASIMAQACWGWFSIPLFSFPCLDVYSSFRRFRSVTGSFLWILNVDELCLEYEAFVS